MSVESTISEADILEQVIAPNSPGFTPEVAQSLLKLRFGDEAQDRMRVLMDKNNKGASTDAEQAEMEKYLRVGMFLDLIQAKARVALKQAGPSG
jgi:hypothetical protein